MAGSGAPVLILGSGLAGYTVAREFRKLDRDTPLVIVSRDAAGFYSKPMLSNALAAGKTAAALEITNAAGMAAQLGAKVLANTEVHAIDTAARLAHTAGGPLEWRQLVLAPGADPMVVPIEGDAADAVLQVNDLADYARFRTALESGRRVVLLGAGLIGCEFANDLAGAGYGVELVDPAPQALGRLLPPEAARRVQDALSAIGVRWHLGTTARAVSRNGAALRVALANGTVLEADTVLSAIGLRPRLALARAAGLAVNRGIVVDRMLRTSAPDVYALGDAAEVEGRVLPFVLPLMAAARALAKTLAGTPTPLAWPAMPVVVKTPAMPVVVSPPADPAGGWRIEADAAGMTARYEDPAGTLTGFALVGAATAQKQALAKGLPPILA